MAILNAMLAGGIMVSAWAISVFFVRFWKKTGDRLFALFAIAFFLLGVERVVIVSLPTRHQFAAYSIRLCAFLLIILAVWHKNTRNER
jgi:Family of unknown function (DUF5985)